MIDEIKVQNLALIKDAHLQPAAGLTVLTGETGAGKTALLESCKLLMGMRADSTMVREGEQQADLQGRFFFSRGVQDVHGDEDDGAACVAAACGGTPHHGSEDGASIAEGHGGLAPYDDGAVETECVVRRSLTKDGRSRVQIDGNMANVTQLFETVSPHIDLCSQHDSTTLLKPSTHVSLLDTWAEDAAQVEAYAQALEVSQAAAEELQRVRDAATLSNVQLDQARFVLSQIEAVSPQPGEYEDLVEQLKRAENSEALARTANTTYECLSGENGALDQLNAAIASIEEGARLDDALQQQAQTLREAGYILEDVTRDVLAYRDSVDFDAGTLVDMQERVAAYQGLLRNYGPTVEEVLAAAEDAQRTISSVDNAEFAEQQALAAYEAAEADLARAAEALAHARKQAAPQFAQEVTAVMGQLEMGSAELICKVEDLPRDSWMKSGPTSVELMFAPAASMSPRPLARIASGGELSRVMLALHVVMGKHDEIETLVLDEIDAGVGGATALALAEVLRQIAETHQVIVVTHLPQVAARATKHYIVRKSESGGIAQTAIEEVSGHARTAEIARMLAGNVTEASLKHAEELLAG